MMRFQRLSDWLAWQETLHPSAIDLGLERLHPVVRRMGRECIAPVVITVGGTNGKGSVVRMMEAICRAAGLRTGAYTSPHLVRYNERIRIDGREIDDDSLCRLFAEVDHARGEVSLTYFEFGTLAAFAGIRRAEVDVALLEVGLGGRLDAVNAIDPDVAVITSIGVDHVEWLGPDRESIAREKAGIFRGGRPAVCGEPEPPAALEAAAAQLGAGILYAGRDFRWRRAGDRWDFASHSLELPDLPMPAAPGGVQLGNAATALQALASARLERALSRTAVDAGLRSAVLPGRVQRIPGEVEWVLDVGHNPQSARALAAALAAGPVRGRRLTVLGMLRDKAVEEVAAVLAPATDAWYLAGLPGGRGQSGVELARRLGTTLPGARAQTFRSVRHACRRARADARPGDRILVTGSFLTVAEAFRAGLY